jgi:acetylglutamate kinase
MTADEIIEMLKEGDYNDGNHPWIDRIIQAHEEGLSDEE